jgi:imidazole glycerol-phosphate synthase subunit HisF
VLPAPRVIPTLLLRGTGLVKGARFAEHRYVGDPINAVNIFNSKEVDEIVVLDIDASREKRSIPLSVVEQLGDECLMPFAVGGGIRSVEDIRRLLYAGAEKVVLNTAAVDNPSLITQAAESFGSQCVVVAIDVKKDFFGRERVFVRSGSKKTNVEPVEWAIELAKLGAGEILLTSIDHEGLRDGFNLDLIRRVSESVSIPIIAAGGAKDFSDLATPIRKAGASAAAAGSVFVHYGPKRAVLIQYPTRSELESIFA